MKSGRRWFVLTATLGIALLTVLLVRNIQDEVVFYLTPSEAVERQADLPDGTRFRLAGIVEVGSLSDTGRGYSFRVTDGGQTIPVQLSTTPPQLFQEDASVLLDGYWEQDTFVSDQALIRHDEDYEAPPVGSTTG